MAKTKKKVDIVEEAIADAKAIKQMGIDNAEKALIEHFSPRIKSVISKRIQNEVEEDDYEDDEMEDETEFEDDTDLENDLADEDTFESDDDVSLDDEEIDDFDEEDDEDLGEIMDEMDDDELDIDSDEDLDIDIEDDGDDIGDDDDIDIDIEDDDEDLEEDFDIDLDDDGDDDIDIEMDGDVDDDDEDIDIDLDEDLDEDLEEENVQLKLENKKIKRAYKIIKSELNEIRIVNEKLLYINKLFKAFRLSDKQKLRVVENFDRADTTREIKIVFKTISESFKDSKKKKLNESLLSRDNNSAVKRKTKDKKIINENDDLYARFKKLKDYRST